MDSVTILDKKATMYTFLGRSPVCLSVCRNEKQKVKSGDSRRFPDLPVERSTTALGFYFLLQEFHWSFNYLVILMRKEIEQETNIVFLGKQLYLN